MEPIRVLIVDDHTIVREGLRILLGAESEMQVVGEAANGLEAIHKVRLLHPHVVLMDLVMEGMSGIQAIEQIRNEEPEVAILVLTSFADDDKVFPAIKAGALGYLLKDSTPEQLIQSIRDVFRGEPSLHPRIALKVMRELNRPPVLPPTENPLTGREVDVLRLIAQGLSNQEIAASLSISEWTVRTHVKNIFSKLHLANRTQATLYAIREGISSPRHPL